jgi:transcriptional regulator with XRE-family HTH domain
MYPNLKLQLWRKRIRQNQLAKMIPLDETVLSKIMNGFRVAAPGLRQRIAAVLEADEGWLFEVTTAPEEPAAAAAPEIQPETA